MGLSSLVLMMLEYLTKRCSIWGLHSLDEDLIKVCFNAMVSRGEALDKATVVEWLDNHGWEKSAVSTVELYLEVLAEGETLEINDITTAATENEMLELFGDKLK